MMLSGQPVLPYSNTTKFTIETFIQSYRRIGGTGVCSCFVKVCFKGASGELNVLDKWRMSERKSLIVESAAQKQQEHQYTTVASHTNLVS